MAPSRNDGANLRQHYERVAEKVAFLDTYTKVMAGNHKAQGHFNAVDINAARSHISSAIGHLEGMLEILRGCDAQHIQPVPEQ